MIERMTDNVGVNPARWCWSIRATSRCGIWNSAVKPAITLYGPCQENDYSLQTDKKAQTNQHTELPKSAFTWLPEEQAYQCLEGHRLEFCERSKRNSVSITRSLCRCTFVLRNTAKHVRVSRHARALPRRGGR